MKRRGVTAAGNVVRTNRQSPPDIINTKVEELVGDRPFQNLDDYITQDELRALSENYKRVAGFTLTRRGLTRVQAPSARRNRHGCAPPKSCSSRPLTSGTVLSCGPTGLW